jgi:glycine cleavage system protein P-like pyridoxal-binding family
VNAASGFVHRSLHGHTVAHVILQRVRIVDVQNFMFGVIDKNDLLASLEALLAACFMTYTSTFDTTLRVAHPALDPFPFGRI